MYQSRMSFRAMLWDHPLVLFIRKWADHMSGGLSVAFIALGWVFPDETVKFLLGSYISGLVCVAIITLENRRLKREFNSKLSVTCPIEDRRCKVLATHRQIPCCYYRVLVTNESAGPLQKVRAYLDRVEKDGCVLMEHDTRRLTFEPGHEIDSYEKDLFPNRPHPLDVLMIQDDNLIFVCTREREIITRHLSGPVFGGPGFYFIQVTVLAEKSYPKTISLRFNWNGDWRTASLVVL